MPYYIKQKVKQAPVNPNLSDNYMVNIANVESLNTTETGSSIQVEAPLMVANAYLSPNNFGSESIFYDFGLTFINQTSRFESGITYFLNFKIKNPKGNELPIDLPLKYTVLLKTPVNTDPSSEGIVEAEETANPPQQIGSFTLKVGSEDSYYYYSIVFTPRKDATHLIFRLERKLAESLIDNNKYKNVIYHLLKKETTGEGQEQTTTIKVNEDHIEYLEKEGEPATGFGIFKLTELVENNLTWIKLGFQSRPGTMIVVNKQLIRVGRSGIFQLDKVEVNSFMLASPHGSDWTTIDAFLLDYAYNA